MGEEANGTNDGSFQKRQFWTKCRPNHGVFISNQSLFDFVMARPSELLMCGFLRGCEEKSNFIPNDILFSIKMFFKFIRIEYVRNETATFWLQEFQHSSKR